MGYRSTFITESLDINPPDWFKEKYAEKLHFFDSGVIATKKEFKIQEDEIFKDFQKFLNETGFFYRFIYYHIAILHEDSKISKVTIQADNILYEIYMEGNYHDFLPTS